MKNNLFAALAIASITILGFVGCRGGACSSCGGYPYGYAGQCGYGQQYPGAPAPGYVQPNGGYVQPGYGQAPGVVVPNQVVPAQNQPGAVFNNGG